MSSNKSEDSNGKRKNDEKIVNYGELFYLDSFI